MTASEVGQNDSQKIPFSVYLLALCQALMMSSTSLMITASSLVCLTLTDDKSLVTLPLSLQFLGLMLTSMPASILMGRLGRKQGFLIGTLFGLAGALLMVYAVFNHSFWLFAVGSFLIGIFNGFGIYYRFAAVDMVSEQNGAMLAVVCLVINLNGQTVWHFWAALVALGISWNFLFIGATTLLTQTYREEEKSQAQAQGFNDFAVFTLVTIASLSAGVLQHKLGWQTVNYATLPFVAVIIMSVLWLKMKPLELRLY